MLTILVPTGMERMDALTKLKHGVLPAVFQEELGPCGAEVGDLILGMTRPHEEERLGCGDVKGRLASILQILRK